jgi:hypothetical protein
MATMTTAGLVDGYPCPDAKAPEEIRSQIIVTRIWALLP